MVLSLAACNKSDTGVQMNDDGTIKTFSEEELYDGIFINKDGVYYPLLNSTGEKPNEDLSGVDDSSSHIWFTEYDNLIPEYDAQNKDQLVLYNVKKVPDSITLWKLDDFGYSVGIKFTTNEDGSITFPKEDDNNNYCKYSPVKDVIKENVLTDSEAKIRITSINDTHEFSATDLNADGFMRGLKEGYMYKFNYYAGTVFKSVNIKADTHIFLEDYSVSAASYTELKAKTFVVNLPTDSMENGYWNIEGYGMFKYIGSNTDTIGDSSDENIIGEKGIEEMPTTPSQENNAVSGVSG